jgi:alpha-ribazole phosphatase
MTTIDLLRHGEAAPGLCLGAEFDAPLTTTGWSQMRTVLARKQPPWDGIVSSPLLRCAAFAEELAGLCGLQLKLDSRLRELGFGTWEGRSWSALYRQEGEHLLEFQRNPGFNPAPGGEHYSDFEVRVNDAWSDLMEMAQDGHWLVVTHAGVLRTILRRVLGFPVERLFSLHVPYAGLTRIEQKGIHPTRLVFHGGSL